MTDRFEPFVIVVGEQENHAHTVSASFEGEPRATESIDAALPRIDARELERALEWLERGFIDQAYARDSGGRLFDTLLTGRILTAFRDAYAAIQATSSLRVVLYLPPSLAPLPWELMYDHEGIHGFLARSKTAQLTRHFLGLPEPNRLPAKGPLRILVISAAPRPYPPLSVSEEAESIIASLARHGTSLGRTLRMAQRRLQGEGEDGAAPFLGKLVQVEVLAHATRAQIQHTLDAAESAGRGYHVIHFIGHGDVQGDQTYLLLEQPAEHGSESAEADLVPADEFAELVGQRSVNLVFLNACQTAAPIAFFNSAAHAVMDKGVPAVVGMQTRVLDSAAVELSREFYYAWAAGEPLESALASARRLVEARTAGSAGDWAIPTLYLGPRDALDLELEVPRWRLPWPVRGVWAAVGTLATIIALVGTLFTLPDLQRQIRGLPLINCYWPNQLDKDFNVVVTPFVRLEGSRTRRDPDGTTLANMVYDRIQRELGEMGLEREPAFLSPGQSCPIYGATAEERAKAAAAYAGKTQANLVVFGNLTPGDEENELHLDFYYRADLHGGEPDAVTGRHIVGRAVTYPVALAGKQVEVRNWVDEPVSLRAKALLWITVALSLDANDQQEQALAVLQKAAEQLEDWEDDDGQALLHYFIGREAFWLREFDTAIDALEQAKELNPDYANAYITLGATYYDRAQLFYLPQPIPDDQKQCVNTRHLDRADKSAEDAEQDIERAIQMLEQAVQIAPDAPWPPIESTARLTLGHAYRLRGQAELLAGRVGEAEPWLDKALQEYQSAEAAFSKIQQLQYLAWTHLGIGATYHLQAFASTIEATQGADSAAKHAKWEQTAVHYQAANQEYQQCMEIGASLGVQDRVFRQKVLECGCTYYHRATEDALTQVEQLIKEQ